MTVSHAMRSAVAALVAATTLLALASPASAQRHSVDDPDDDGKWDAYGEVYDLAVDRTAKRLEVSTHFATFTDIHEFQLRKPGSDGWQLLVTWYTDEAADLSDLRKVYVYTRKGLEEGKARCTVKNVTFADWDSQELSFAVPRRCLTIGGEKPTRLQLRELTWTYAGDFNGPTDRTRWTKGLKAGTPGRATPPTG